MTAERFEGNLADSGFVMPAEWQPHACTWVAWPHNTDTWSKNLDAAQREFISLVKTIAIDEPVVVAIPNDRQADIFNRRLLECEIKPALDIWTIRMNTNDAWIRDYGPTFVARNDRLAAVDWKYNAWGGKYPPFDDDQKVARRCLNLMPPFASNDNPVLFKTSELCIEGGALEIDAGGAMMCTKSCAMDQNRNPDWTLDQIEYELRGCLGGKQIIWLDGDAIAGDDTDGHIDQLARFVPGHKIVYAWTNDLDDPQRQNLQSNLDQLRQALSQFGMGYQLVPLPLPQPIHFHNLRLPASYCNFYITNRSVVVPQFDQPKSDQQALEILISLFPDRNVVGLPSVNLIAGLGSFHCLTQQQPAVL